MRRKLLILVVALACNLICTAALAQLPVGPRHFELLSRSSYTEGCFDPCACPIWMVGDVVGGFVLVPTGVDGSFWTYDVVDVAWTFLRAGSETAAIGAGIYRVDPANELQQLELDLRLGEDPVQHFDSGLVPVFDDAPAISIAIAVNGFFCYDYAFAVFAEPSDPIAEPVLSAGMLKARY